MVIPKGKYAVLPLHYLFEATAFLHL